MEEHDQSSRTSKCVAVKILGCIATPLVQDKPDKLLSGKIGVSAVSPESRGVESSVKISLSIFELLGNLGLGLILVLGLVVI